MKHISNTLNINTKTYRPQQPHAKSRFIINGNKLTKEMIFIFNKHRIS